MDLSNVVWRKASRSTENGGDCVELASLSNVIAVRDSKDPDGLLIIMNHNEFHSFARTLKKL